MLVQSGICHRDTADCVFISGKCEQTEFIGVGVRKKKRAWGFFHEGQATAAHIRVQKGWSVSSQRKHDFYYICKKTFSFFEKDKIHAAIDK